MKESCVCVYLHCAQHLLRTVCCVIMRRAMKIRLYMNSLSSEVATKSAPPMPLFLGEICLTQKKPLLLTQQCTLQATQCNWFQVEAVEGWRWERDSTQIFRWRQKAAAGLLTCTCSCCFQCEIIDMALVSQLKPDVRTATMSQIVLKDKTCNRQIHWRQKNDLTP